LKIKNLVGFDGVLEFDTTKPDGTMRKVMDCSKINSIGWQPKTSLDKGLQLAYMQYQLN
jgi:GDP-L-fucose synthase